jgi:hypothetical protein
MPWMLKYALLAVGAVLWLLGLVEQFHSIPTTATYLVLSLVIALLALL